jgi:chemotaxis protein histidine kinase CheA
MKIDTIEKIELLKSKFRLEIPSRLEEIEQKFIQGKNLSFNKKEFEEFYRYIHSLTGAGSTFGEKELSQSALSFENELKIFLDKSKIPNKEDFINFEVYMNDLKNICTNIINKDTKE